MTIKQLRLKERRAYLKCQETLKAASREAKQHGTESDRFKKAHEANHRAWGAYFDALAKRRSAQDQAEYSARASRFICAYFEELCACYEKYENQYDQCRSGAHLDHPNVYLKQGRPGSTRYFIRRFGSRSLLVAFNKAFPEWKSRGELVLPLGNNLHST